MNQIAASFHRTIREFLREKAALFWTIAWPIVWVLISTLTFIRGVPEAQLPYAKGDITISMMTFALMMAGMANLPGSIADDRSSGMLAKLISMPVSPARDFAGRVLALAAFSALAAGAVIAVGVALGARFALLARDAPLAIGLIILIICTAAGLGLIIGTLVKRTQGAIMTGVSLSVVTAAISGIYAPYDMLPAPLQAFARVYPTSSATTLTKYFMLGKEMAPYPATLSQITLTTALSLVILAIGISLYSRLAWKLE